MNPSIVANSADLPLFAPNSNQKVTSSPTASAPLAKADEGLAWATLDALGVTGRAAREIEDKGGPVAWMAEDPLEIWSLRERSRRRKGREAPLPIDRGSARIEVRSRIGVARKKACELRPFLAEGGLVVGGANLGRLLRAKSPPLCVYASGAVELLEVLEVSRAIAMVGSRMPTERGETRAKEWAQVFAAHGVVVVSGAARGIDLAAHTGALLPQGNTIAVLGDSVKIQRGVVSHRPTRLQDAFNAAPNSSRGLSVTSSGPWVHASRSSFVSRNRLVAALSDAVVVVEAGAGSGAIHTVDNANALGIPVFAVPGDPDADRSFESNAMIEDGRATLLTDPRALISHLGISVQAEGTTTAAVDPASLPPLLRILAVAKEARSVDDVAEELSLSVSEVLQQALMLELDGRIRRTAGNLAFVR